MFQFDKIAARTVAMSSISHAALAAVLVLTVGCEKDAKDAAKAAPEAVAKAAPEAAAAKTAGTATEADCEAYAKSLCTAAGEKSATCVSIKQMVKLLPPAACKAGASDLDYSKKQLASIGKPCEELVKKLCSDLGTETETCKMVTTKTSQFGATKCTEMMTNYPKVLAQLKRMEDANKPLSPEQMALLTTPGGGDHGSKDAKVTIVEFSDFQCPYCTRAATATKKLKEKYGDKVRIVFRQFPLNFHKQAHLAAQASLAANEQGKFWEMHDKMFENQRKLERADLDGYAKSLGLNMGKFKAALDSGKFKAQVDADMALGSKVAVSGTPTMFLNGKRVANAGDPDGIGKLIDAILGGK